jgi:capping protein alpha
VTDVVEEQVGGGEVEPLPTPATEEVPEKQEEVVEPGGLEKVDSAVVLAREAEEKEEQAAAKETEEGGVEEEPRVEEVVTAGGEPTSTAESETQVVSETAPAKPPRKQERVENPVYTLEVVGNRYNISNFW